MTRAAAWLLLGLAAAAGAATPEVKRTRTLALFADLQEAPAFTPDEMAARQKDAAGDDEGAAADVALNGWKTCVTEAIQRWAPLKQGPGTLIDGAFGRCADLERGYRTHLMKMTQDGRQMVDISMARSMTRQLEENWRLRLTAEALDQDLARLNPPPAQPGGLPIPAVTQSR